MSGITRIRSAITALLGAAMLGSMAVSVLAQSPSAPQQRPYEDGPLTAGDYRTEPPEDDGGLDAFTTTDLRFRYEYRSRTTPRRVTIWTTKIMADAVVVPGKSWNRRPEDTRLLDHEQGHFDLSYIAALRARLHFARQGRITATAASSEDAVRGLEKEIQRQMQEFVDAVLSEHHEYDRRTRHGLDRRAQLKERESQREEIARLSAQFQGEDGRDAAPPAGRATPASPGP